MITISKEVFVNGNNPFIGLQDVAEGNYEVVIILQAIKKPKRRRAGFSKARFVMSDDFNAPLEDFKEYMQ
jgi:Protein of unknown function (DUF2281)